MEWLRKIFYARLKFYIEVTSEMFLPPFKGFTYKGALGKQFKHLVCLEDYNSACSKCILRENCPYAIAFETPNSFKIDKANHEIIEHPVVLEPSLEDKQVFEPGAVITFQIILLGDIIEITPYFIFVFTKLGRRFGLGKNRKKGAGRFKLIKVNSIDERDKEHEIYSQNNATMTNPVILSGDQFFSHSEYPQSSLTFKFDTPVRIKYKSKFLLQNSDDKLHSIDFLEPLHRRLYYLYAHYFSDKKNEEPIFPNYKLPVISDQNLAWKDYTHWSDRQKRFIKIGGFRSEEHTSELQSH